MQRASRSTASRIRIAILLSLLLLVALYAAHDFYSRRERTAWRRTLNVALVIVEQGQVAPAALDALRARVPALEQRLKDEFRRYRPGAPAPFAFVVFGAVPLGTPPPKPPSEGALELVRHAIDVFRFTRDTDRRALVPTRGFDARLYLVVRPPASAEQAFVEGASKQGGRVGIARCELDDEMADLALFVAAHELFHTLNASDKYDSAGRTRIPEGLAEPERVPPFPQAYAEVMARNRPLDAVNEVPPTSLAELRVGPLTASEVGWSAPRGAAP